MCSAKIGGKCCPGQAELMHVVFLLHPSGAWCDLGGAARVPFSQQLLTIGFAWPLGYLSLL